MRAWMYHGNKDIRLEEVPDPVPGPGEVSVEIAYNGICGSDLHEYFDGPLFTPIENRHPKTRHLGPVILGHEASGTVAALGDGVTDLAVGDRVVIEPIVRQKGDDNAYNLDASFYGLMTNGFLADRAVVTRTALHSLPPEVDLAAGALAEPLAVAWHAANKTRLEPGDAAVVFGGGPIGIGSALSLRALGTERILVVEPSQQRRKILEHLGVLTVDPTTDDYRSQLSAFTGPGVKACIDAAGVPSAVHDSIESLAPGGQLVVVAGHVAPVTIELNRLLLSERSIVTSMGYRNDFPDVLKYMASGAFPTESWVETIEFENLAEGIDRLKSGEAVKVLVEVAGK